MLGGTVRQAISLFAIVVWTSFAQAATTSTPLPSGVYKHLAYVEEAGDLLGMALRIDGGKTPRVTVTTCEGGCYGGESWPLHVDQNGISFTVCDALVGQDGKPAKCNPVHYVGRFRRDGALIVSIPGQRDRRFVLQRVSHPKPRATEELACAGTHC